MTIIGRLWNALLGCIIFSLFAGFGFFVLYIADSLPNCLYKIPQIITGVHEQADSKPQHSRAKKKKFGPVQFLGWAFIVFGVLPFSIGMYHIFVPGAQPAPSGPDPLSENHPFWALVFCLVLVAIGIFLMYHAAAEKRWAQKAIRVPGRVVRVNEHRETETIKDKDGRIRGRHEVTYYSSVISFHFEDEEREIVLPVEKGWKDAIGKEYLVGINPNNTEDARVIDSSVQIFPIFAGVMCILFALLIAHIAISEIVKSSLPRLDAPSSTPPAVENPVEPPPTIELKDLSPEELQNAFNHAVMSGNASQVTQLIKQGVDINQRGPLGYTPLMLSALYGDLDIIKQLLDAGADINASVQTENNPPLTALKVALANNHPEVAEFLKSAGAKE